MQNERRQFQKSVVNEKPENQQKQKNNFISTTMKTMKNFAAQQLSKTQMNEVTGGRSFDCTITYPSGDVSHMTIQASDMTMLLHITDAITPAGGSSSCK